MRVDVIAVPYDSARRGERMGAGPERLLEAGLATRLERDGHSVRVRRVEAPDRSWRAEIGTAFQLARGVAHAVSEATAAGAFPLVLSGNCGPAALGCVSGLRRPTSVVWFDAHGDFNTPETTIGGFLDGMSLATLTGRCWAQLSAAIPGFRAVPEGAVTLVGARDLDPLEAAALDRSAVRRVTVAGLRPELTAAVASIPAGNSVYIHLDLDVLDPGEGPVNQYATPDGLRRADLEWAIETIAGRGGLAVAALTAYDPGADVTGRAADAALALAAAVVRAAASRADG